MERLAYPTSADLMAVLRQEQVEEDSNHNVTLKCQDGCVKTCGLLLAAVSPLMRLIGKTEPDLDDLSVHLPDFGVAQVRVFLRVLVSAQGPRSNEEEMDFVDLLTFFGKGESFIDDFNDVDLKDEEIKEDIAENDWEEQEDAFYEDEIVETKKKRKSVRLKRNISEPTEDNEHLNREARESYDVERGLYICQRCGTERKNTRSMQQHLTWHQKYPHEDFHTSHICKECGKVCADHSLLRAHVRLVHSPRIFQCDDESCGKSFKSKEGLKQHLLVHSGVKNFVCSECGYAVRTKHHLKLHVLKRHTTMKKTIPCEVCGKLFRHISNLKCHFYTHKARQERQHRCEACSLTFRTQKSLDSHMALHDPTRPFECSKCPLRYKNKDALVAHENTHQNNQFKCDFCDIAYTRKDNLKRHIKEKHAPASNAL